MITTVLPKVLRLTDSQLVALSKAVQAADRCVQPPANLRGAAVSRFFGGLITRGLVDAVEGTGAPGEGNRIYAITPLGLQAIGIDERGDGGADTPNAELAIIAAGNAQPAEASLRHAGIARARNTDKGRTAGEVDPAASEPPGSRQPPVSAPRTASKLGRVIALLEREHGASVREIMASTGWLAHTTRAALSGLRKRGYELTLVKGSEGQESRYSISGHPAPGDAAA